MKDYSNAFAEVYEILNHLEEDSYNKIPTAFLEVIRENRNPDYEYIVYENIELQEHEMLPETKAILFNIFRDYLATSEQREKIINIQAEERKLNEIRKRKEYYRNKELNEKIELNNDENEEKIQLVSIESPKTLWWKIKMLLKKLLKK